jgi:hypothetical protein
VIMAIIFPFQHEARNLFTTERTVSFSGVEFQIQQTRLYDSKTDKKLPKSEMSCHVMMMALPGRRKSPVL